MDAANVSNHIVFDQQRAVLQDAAIGVHRDNSLAR
jgi:hypothetical protein